jgi:acylphosphatase
MDLDRRAGLARAGPGRGFAPVRGPQADGFLMAIERRRVHYSGHVQGVGFRYTAHRIAQGYNVGGYVQNLPDGRVEVVVEGTRADVDAFLETVRVELDHHVRTVTESPEPAGDPPYFEFFIRY